MNSLHDVGGMDGFGPVKWENNEPVFHEHWEAHMRAIDALMTKKLRAYVVDETRHRIERMNPVYYLGSSYYQIWLLRMETLPLPSRPCANIDCFARLPRICRASEK
jgi:nitrile hydratase